MEKEQLFRMNFVIQDNATMTLDTNLVKIVEAVLFDSQNYRLSIEEIAIRVKEDYELDFTSNEISTAIKRRGKNIDCIDKKYCLKPEYRNRLASKEDFNTQIRRYSKMAIEEIPLDVSEDRLEKIITDYLYYSFNTNKDSIFCLLDNKKIINDNCFNSDEDRNIINSFLKWDNEEKNKFVYNVVSYGYIYCTLTVKKDGLLANKIFKGKVFILDANIIFRLAGINNDSRMKTITSFVEKCGEVGVSLGYTSRTLDEICRVIDNKVNWINKVIGNSEPINVSEFDYSENDFYSIYCKWSSEKGNIYNDLLAFKKYLTNLVFDVIEPLDLIDSENFELKNKQEFTSYCKSLLEYKTNHSSKKQSNISISTDVNNLLQIKNMRKKSSCSIWNTNVFFISADQHLIKWSNEIETGVPLIVLPSVWLTIMLRFSGRTSDDYKAFCSFLQLRTHDDSNKIDVFELLKKLSEKTKSSELKSLIVKEVFDHKSEYQVIDDNYDEIVNKAFDVILEDQRKNEDERYINIQKEYNRKSKEIEDYKTKKNTEEEFKIIKMVSDDVKSHFAIINVINKNILPISIVFFAFLLYQSYIAFSQKGIIYLMICNFSGEKNIGIGNIWGGLGFFWAIAVIVAGFFGNCLRSLNSEKRRNKFKNKRIKYYRDIFSMEEDS